jgi:hypothetical protein
MTRAWEAATAVAVAPAGDAEEPGRKAAAPALRRPFACSPPSPLFPPPLGPPAAHACMDPAARHEPDERGVVELPDGARLAW